MELSTGFLIIVTFSPVIYGERNYYTDGNTLSSANVQQTDVVLCGGGGRFTQPRFKVSSTEQHGF